MIGDDQTEKEEDRKSLEFEGALNRNNEIFIENFKSAILFGIEAIKALFLLNSAGLTAVGTIATISKDNFSNFTPAFISFSIGLFVSFIVTAASYGAQYCYARRHGAIEIDFRKKYMNQTDCSNKWQFIGECVHGIAILLSIVSTILFMIGLYFIWNGFY